MFYSICEGCWSKGVQCVLSVKGAGVKVYSVLSVKGAGVHAAG